MYSVFPPVALNLRKQFEISKYFSEKKKKTKPEWILCSNGSINNFFFHILHTPLYLCM